MISMMNHRSRPLLLLLMLVIVVGSLDQAVVEGNVVFNVKHKYGGHRRADLSTLYAHDLDRHGRYLASLNLPVGGDGKTTGTGLYYTKLSIGTPARDFHLQLDTGSDLMWVNCAGCDKCQTTKSRLGFHQGLYDMKASPTAKGMSCDEDICRNMIRSGQANCTSGNTCEFFISYMDGSGAGGNVLKDNIKFEESSGDGQSKAMDQSIAFGCNIRKTGKTSTSTEATDGIVGLGQSELSIIRQLEMANKTKAAFSHCLDSKNGGGVFAIGRVVQPEVKNMVPLLPGRQHYSIIANSIEVGGKTIELGRRSIFGLGTVGMNTVIDTGATLAILPSAVYVPVIEQIIAGKSDLQLIPHGDMTCFKYKGDIDNIDKDFPNVTIQFKNSVSLKVYPHDYLFLQKDDQNQFCFGIVNKDLRPDGEDVILLGDVVLSSRLFVYDLDNQEMGWIEYECNSTIKVKDDGSGNAYSMGAKNLYPLSDSTRNGVHFFTFPLIIAVVYFWV